MKWKQILDWKHWINGGKNQWLLILLVGILMVVIVLPVKDSEEGVLDGDTGNVKGTDTKTGQTEWNNYRKDVEEQLETMLANVEGVGKVQVMVTLADSGEIVVEKDVPQNQKSVEEQDATGGSRATKESSWQETTVYIEQDGEQVPYVIKEQVPEIEGICVICQGGNNGTVAQNISDAVQALFPIEIHKIKVMKMK